MGIHQSHRRHGGMVAAIERSYPQREIAEASYRYQMAVDKKKKSSLA